MEKSLNWREYAITRLIKASGYSAIIFVALIFFFLIPSIPATLGNFLLPLMLQLGFGLSPVQSGLLTFVSSIGAIFMKTVAARTLNLLGFRRVLFWNALAASGFLCAFGLFRPGTPELVILATLLVSGCCRSLQFTSLNAISFADVDDSRMAQGSTLSGMLQQLSLSLGVVSRYSDPSNVGSRNLWSALVTPGIWTTPPTIASTASAPRHSAGP